MNPPHDLGLGSMRLTAILKEEAEEKQQLKKYIYKVRSHHKYNRKALHQRRSFDLSFSLSPPTFPPCTTNIL
jgi:hypothetical protein